MDYFDYTDLINISKIYKGDEYYKAPLFGSGDEPVHKMSDDINEFIIDIEDIDKFNNEKSLFTSDTPSIKNEFILDIIPIEQEKIHKPVQNISNTSKENDNKSDVEFLLKKEVNIEDKNYDNLKELLNAYKRR